PAWPIKAALLIRLVEAYADLDEEINDRLVEKAFAVIAEANKAAASETEPGVEAGACHYAGTTWHGCAHMEAQLLSAIGRVDLHRALDRARRLPNEKKVAAIIQILQTFTERGHGC